MKTIKILFLSALLVFGLAACDLLPQELATALDVIEAIEDLPNAIDLTEEDGAAILSARALYESLTAEEKLLVTNLNVLIGLETAFSQLPGTLVDEAIKAQFLTLVAAVTEADLVDALSGESFLTVFAPTDAAFGRLLAALETDASGLLAHPFLSEILLYHVLDGRVLAEAVLGLIEVGSGRAFVRTLLGAQLELTIVEGSVVINGVATITQTDVIATNGVIHIIDEVLIPAHLVEVALNSGFTILGEALTQELLVETLSTAGPFTVFAPTNDAFASLLTALDVSKEALLAREDLSDILLYHVVEGKVLAEAVVGLITAGSGTATVPTLLAGKVLTLTLDGGRVVINGSVYVEATDFIALNGVIHVIDGVLIPPVDPIQLATPVNGFNHNALTNHVGIGPYAGGTGYNGQLRFVWLEKGTDNIIGTDLFTAPANVGYAYIYTTFLATLADGTYTVKFQAVGDGVLGLDSDFFPTTFEVVKLPPVTEPTKLATPVNGFNHNALTNHVGIGPYDGGTGYNGQLRFVWLEKGTDNIIGTDLFTAPANVGYAYIYTTFLATLPDGTYTVKFQAVGDGVLGLDSDFFPTTFEVIKSPPVTVPTQLAAPVNGINHNAVTKQVGVGAYAGGTGYSGQLRFVWFIKGTETVAGSDLLNAPAPNGSAYLYETFLATLADGTYTVKFLAVGDQELGLDSEYSIHTFEVTKVAPVEPGANLLATTGGNLLGWSVFNDGTGQLTLSEIDSKIAINVTGIGGADYQPHIYQTLSSLAIGEYRFTLKLDASVARHVRFNIVLPNSGFASILGGAVNLLTTTGTTLEYELTFSVVNPITNVKIELAFGNLGVGFTSTVGNFTIQEVSFIEVVESENPDPVREPQFIGYNVVVSQGVRVTYNATPDLWYNNNVQLVLDSFDGTKTTATFDFRGVLGQEYVFKIEGGGVNRERTITADGSLQSIAVDISGLNETQRNGLRLAVVFARTVNGSGTFDLVSIKEATTTKSWVGYGMTLVDIDLFNFPAAPQPTWYDNNVQLDVLDFDETKTLLTFNFIGTAGVEFLFKIEKKVGMNVVELAIVGTGLLQSHTLNLSGLSEQQRSELNLIIIFDKNSTNGSLMTLLSIVASSPAPDTVDPVISGANDVSIDVGSTFNPLTGVTANDDVDGNVTSSISVVIKNSLDEVVLSVDTALAGVYTVTYSVTDAAGNEATKTITVTVVEPLPEEPENIVANGDIALGVTDWDNSLVKLGNITLTEETGELKVVVIPGSNSYDGRFGQVGIPFVNGVKYEVSFDARSSANKEIFIQIGEMFAGPPYFTPFTTGVNRTITTTMQTYTIIFTMGVNNPRGGLVFELGRVNNQSVSATMYFDNFKVVEYVDTDGPVISGAKDASINVGSTFDPLTGVTALDITDGNVTSSISAVIKNSLNDVVSSVDTTATGVYTVTYSVTDTLSNNTTLTITITVVEGVSTPLTALSPLTAAHLAGEGGGLVNTHGGGLFRNFVYHPTAPVSQDGNASGIRISVYAADGTTFLGETTVTSSGRSWDIRVAGFNSLLQAGNIIHLQIVPSAQGTTNNFTFSDPLILTLKA